MTQRWSTCFFIALFSAHVAHGFVAHEWRKGAIELKPRSPHGFAVREFAYHKDVTYFCVQDMDLHTKRLPQANLPRRCFYVPHHWKPVHLSNGYQVAKIRYQLKGRIFNSSGRIPVGSGQYFYPVQNITLVSRL